MSTNKFLLGFLVVALVSYAKSQLTHYWVPIEFSFFLIFFIIRSCDETRALIFTFVLSLGLDLILQVGQLKGLGCVGQLLLVFLIMKAMRGVVPNLRDMFLLAFFAIFYIANYTISLGLSRALDSYYPVVSVPQLLFLSVFHTGFFALLLLANFRLERGKK